MKPPKSFKRIPSEKEYPISKGLVSMGRETYNPQPNLSLGETHLKEIKDWKIGKSYPLELMVKMVSLRTEDYGPTKGKVIAEFKITGIKYDNEKI